MSKPFAFLALVLAFAGLGLPARAADTHPVVVELFTSQGCSSCPPADAFLGELADRADVIALTFPVDYWDYLGWKDTLAIRDSGERQHGYSGALGSRRVYTPQMVVAGSAHVVGSDRGRVLALIERAATQSEGRLAVDIRLESGHVLLRLPDSEMPVEATIWLAAIDEQRSVPIGRGENGGRTVVYRNVVREVRNLGLYRGKAMEIAVSYEDLANRGRSGCAAIVQKGQFGPVLGAAKLDYGSEAAPVAAAGGRRSR